MKYNPYSFSKMNVFKSCPKKFEYQYIEKIKVPRVPQIHFERGAYIHLLLEYDTIEEANLNLKPHDSQIITETDKQECVKIVQDFKKSKIGAWYDTLKPLYKEVPIALDPKLNTTDFDQYYTKKNLYQGFIDNVSVLEDKNLLVITDWKSGKVPEKTNWEQLMYYSIWAFNEIPFDNVLLCLTYVQAQERKQVLLKRADINKYKKALVNDIKSIETCTKFSKNITGLCNYCDFQEICES